MNVSDLGPTLTSSEPGLAANGSSSNDAQVPTPEHSDTHAFALASVPRFAPGEVIGNRFRIERFIARGGMGEVFEVFDLDLKASIAMKALAMDRERSTEALARFKREALLARSVTHPNVCRVFDVGFHHDARSNEHVAFMTMELLRGETLRELIQRVGALKPELGLRIARDICAGLSAAHAQGIIHRDLKSSNVMLQDTEEAGQRAIITDFGLARQPEGDDTLTREGRILGTPATMAPEQILGEKVTPATDIYALGCLLFEMLAATVPFPATSSGNLHVRLLRPAPRLRLRQRNAPIHWEHVVKRCLERKPERRFQQAAQVLRALEAKARFFQRRIIALTAMAIVLMVVAAEPIWQRHQMSSELLAQQALALQLKPMDGPARASDPQREAAAEVLFADGQRLHAEHKDQEACERFEQSRALDRAVGTSMYLADCYENVGRLASAWALWLETSSQAYQSGQDERASISAQRGRLLFPKLARLSLAIPADEPEGFELTLDGMPIASKLAGVGLPLDPGTHQVRARAKGFDDWSTNVEIAAGPSLRTLEVPPLPISR